ncbi:cadherin-like domain-containing protein [Marinobacter adhaerens]|uniref:Cadherin-like domain-containing protein n=1 Tax=Marinobacter adhaerens TaxID=1033846 RepID=A0A851I0D6_9GAMM|nr:putative Ig domain-containing protein [Marinobacter adhaerens]NWN91628.1 cadherin-like domain-containing protein [Marinobacter adhaerens]
MATLAIVVSLVGKAWAENADGERRALEVGDRLGAEETLIMAEGARIDLDFGDNQQLTFLGEQQVTAQAREDLVEEADSLAPLEERTESGTEQPRVADEGASAQGHSFVQLVRIGEIIEADGITPVTVARIQEVLRPMGLSLPQAEFDRYEPRETWSSAGRHEANDSFPETGSKLSELSISVDVIAGDDIVDATEAQQTITLSGTVGGGVQPGDTVTVTVNGQSYETTVNADGKTWQVGVPGSELAQDSSVQAIVDSVEPNGTPVSAETERPYEVDNATPDASVELKGAGPDGIYNESEIVDGKVPGEVILGSNTEPGDTIVVTDGKGNELINRPVTQDDIDNGIIVDVPVEHDQSDVEVNVELTDPTGNTSSATDSKPVDAVPPQLSIEIEGEGSTAHYDAAKITNGQAKVTVKLTAGTVKEGDQLVVTDGNGNIVIDRPVTQAEVTSGEVDVLLSVAQGQQAVNVEAVITDPAGNSGNDTDSKVILSPELAIDSAQVDNAAGTIDISGNTTDVAPNTDVEITITDHDGNQVTTTAMTDTNGDYSVTGTDISDLTDGPLDIKAETTDHNGNAIDDTANDILDHVAGDLTVDGSTVDDAGQTIDIEGSTTDVSPGEEVTITVKDQDGNEVTTTTTVNPGGSYDVTGENISSLVDGPLEITAESTDNNGNPVSGTGNDALDNLAGDITVAFTNDPIADPALAEVTGTTVDVAPGETVNLTFTDLNGQTTTATAVVVSDGTYSTTVDLRGLTDGDLTVDAAATDRNSDSVSASDNAELDAIAADIAIDYTNVDDGAGTIYISGSTKDVAPNSDVEITIADKDGNEVTASATTDAAGNYVVNGTAISGLTDGPLDIKAETTDHNGNLIDDTATDALDHVTGDLTVDATTVDDGAQTVDISGSTTDVHPGETVTITIKDQDGNTVTVAGPVEVQGDGSYSVTDEDISSLVDGPLEITAEATDNNGNPVNGTGNDVLDNLAGDITVEFATDTITDAAVTDVTGTTTDVAPGEVVNLTFTDQNLNTVTTTAVVANDGTYTTTVDLRGLTDGDITVDATATDRNSDPVNATDNAELDAVAADIVIDATSVDDTAGTIDISGSTTDVAPGSDVEITVTDKDGNTVTATVTVQPDGSYSVTGEDISGLTDGPLDIKAETTDHNGNAIDDTATDALDHVAGDLTVDTTTVDDVGQTIDIEGSTTDVHPGETVTITIKDQDGNEVTTTTTINPDGSYNVTGEDISSLVDGPLDLTAESTDNNGNPVNGTGNDALDNLAGDITVAFTNDPIADPALAEVTGTTVDVAPGETVNLTFTDVNGQTTTATAVVASDGTYSTTVDLRDLTDGKIDVDAKATDRNSDTVNANNDAVLDAVASDIAINHTSVDDGAGTIDISGSTTDVAEGADVKVTITDQNNVSVVVTVQADSNGNYTVTGEDISGLTDGPLDIQAETVDHNGNPIDDTVNDILDHVAGDITVDNVTVDNTAKEAVIKGSTDDVPKDAVVEITLTDGEGNTATGTTTVDGDGNYTSDGIDTSGLVDGDFTVDVKTTDNNGNEVTGESGGNTTGSTELDQFDGDLTVGFDAAIDAENAIAVPVSGTTDDVAAGDDVTLTFTSSNGGAPVVVTTTVAADGTYSTTADLRGLTDGDITVDATATDRNGETVADDDTAIKDALAAEIAIDTTTVDDTTGEIDITGSTTDVAEGTDVVVTITDQNNVSVDVTVQTDADGNYTVTEKDIKGLTDGDLTITAETVDHNGNPIDDTATDAMDHVSGDLTVDTTIVDDGAQTVDISGSTTDVHPGEEVIITIKDQDGNEVTTTTTVNPDGIYDVTGENISSLVDGSLDITAESTDNNGNPVSGTGVDAMDNLAGDITVAFTNDPIADPALAEVTGSTTDVAPGEEVTLTFTDQNGDTTTAIAVVDSSGEYTTTVDLRGLTDGRIDVDATATDRNSDTVNATNDAVLDAVVSDIAINYTSVDDGAGTIDISGSTTDVAEGTGVVVTITDQNNISVDVTVQTDANGNYTVTEEDISGLTDGPLDIKAETVDHNNNTIDDTANDILDHVASDITVDNVTVDNTAKEAVIKGSTDDVPKDAVVEITLTDGEGNTATGTTTVDGDGNYTSDEIDTSGLVDGDFTVDVKTTDNNGNEVTGESDGNTTGDTELDQFDGDLTVGFDAPIDAENAIAVPVSGATDDVAPGTVVNLTFTDQFNNQTTGTAVVATDGTYTTTADLRGLTDGDITVDATATDRNGEAVSDDDAAIKDALAADIAIGNTSIDDGAGTIDIAGTTTDVAEGTDVVVTITDQNNVSVDVTVQTDANGNYTVTEKDIKGLTDGDLTITAETVDHNGNDIDDTANDVLDYVDGKITVENVTVDDDNQTVSFDGKTEDVPENATVNITVTDKDGSVATGTAVVGGNGNYIASDIDISGLVDGDFDIDVSTTDNNGEDVDGAGNGTLDNIDDTITVNLDHVTSANETAVTVTGSTTDVPAGSDVTLTLTDGTNTHTATATVAQDGSYVTVVDLNSLDDGPISVDAAADGRNQAVNASDNAIKDVLAPSLTITSADPTLADTETTEITFTFSEAVTGFDAADITVAGGALTNLATTDDITWKADFTADGTGDISIEVADDSYTDVVGNLGTGNNHAINTAPTASDIALAAEDAESFAYEADALFADADSDSLSYSATGLPTGLSINANTGLISGDLDSSASQVNGGQYTIEVTVNDGQGGTNTADITLNVTNPAPVVDATIEDKIFDDNDTVSIQTSQAFNDPDGDTITYSASNLPSGLTIESATGEITGTLDSSASQGGTNLDGNYIATITADDGEGGSVSTDFTISVNNPAPVVDPVQGRIADDGELVEIQTQFTDPDGDELTYEIVSGAPAGFTIDNNGKISGTLTNDASQEGVNNSGVYHIKVKATDADDAEVEDIIELVVKNPAPIVEAPLVNATVDDGAAFTLDTSTVFNDPDGDDLTYSVTGLPGGLTMDTSTGEITGTLSSNASQHGVAGDGKYTIEVTVDDGQGGTVSDTFELEVSNTAPVAENDAKSTDEDTALHVNAAGGVLNNDTDPNSDTLTVTQISEGGTDVLPGQAIVGSNGGIFRIFSDGSYSFDPNGKYDYLAVDESEKTTVSYTISDGKGGTDTAELTITVDGVNNPPVAEDDQVISDASGVTIDVLENDSDVDATDTLTITEVNSAPISVGSPINTTEGQVTLNADGTLTFVPDSSFSGNQASFDYTINDSNGGTDSATVIVDVLSVSITDDNSIDGNLDQQNTPDSTLASIDDLANTEITGNIPQGGSVISLEISDGTNTINVDPNDIAIYPNGSFITTVDTTGLDDGNITVSLQAENSQGDTGTSTDNILKDTVTEVEINPLDVVNGEVPVVTGTGEPEATIIVSVDDGTGKVKVGEATVDNNGDWTFTPTNPIDPTFKVIADATDKWGNTDDINGDPASDSRDIPSLDTGLTIEVDEAGLGIGSEAGNKPIAVSSSFTLGGNDDLQHIVVDGTTVTKAALEDLAVNPVTITQSHYTIELTGYDSGTGEVSYTYTLTDPVAHDAPPAGTDSDTNIKEEAITVVVVDVNNDTRTGNIKVEITDDVPTAEDGVLVNVAEGGEVITGDLLANDVQGADEAHVYDITYNDTNGDPQTALVDATNGVTVTTQFGELTVNSDGSWSYTSNDAVHHDQPANDTEIVDNFSYRLIDGDGDISNTATQAIDVLDTEPVFDNVSDSTVDEANLTTGSEPNASELVVNGDLSVTPGQDTFDVTFDENIEAPAGLTSGGEAVTYALSNDGHTLTATAGGNTVFTAQINYPTDSAAGYTFTLHDIVDHNGAEALDLTFAVVVTDSDGDTDSSSFDVKVMDDEAPDTVAYTIDEDGDITFNASADATVSNTKIYDDGGTELTGTDNASDGKDYKTDHGTVTVNAEGTITYTPDPDYSGEEMFTFKTQDGTSTEDTTVTMTVNPVADAPTIDVDNAAITTDEDVAIALGLNAPVITDDGTSSGNNPTSEHLGEITLEGFPEGAKLLADGGSELHTFESNGSVSITLTDGVHTAGATGDLSMSTSDFESLKVLPPAEDHKNFIATVKATSYEVDTNGERLADVDGAETSTDITVNVQAVTDPVDLKINDGVNFVDAADASSAVNITMDEDVAFDLADLLQITLDETADGNNVADADGSEERWFTVTGLPEGSDVNGHTITAAESTGGYRVDIPNNYNGVSPSLPKLEITAPEDFSGDIDGVKVTLHAQDRDSDGVGSGPTTGDELTEDVYVDLNVNPIAGDVIAGDVSTDEDTAVAFMENIEVTDKNVGDSNEVITKVAFELPTDWKLTSQPEVGDAEWTVTGNDNDGYTINFTDGTEAEREAALKEFEITPPAHSSQDKTISVKVTTKDSNTVNDQPEEDIKETTLGIKVNVAPVAEKIGGEYDGDGNWVPGSEVDTDGDDNPDLTMMDDYTYKTDGEEDEWFDLGTDSGEFQFSEGWSNQDASEDTYAVLTPSLFEGDGTVVSAVGAKFQWDGGSATYTGDPIEVPIGALDSLEFKATKDFAGTFEINVQAKTVDVNADDPNHTAEAISGEATLKSGVIKPVADTATTSLTARVNGKEDEPMDLSIRPNSTDPNEIFDVTLDSIPDGATLTYGDYTITESGVFDSNNYPVTGTGITVATDGANDWQVTFENFDKNEPMTITPPVDSNEEFTLGVSTVTVDTIFVPDDINDPTGSGTTYTHRSDPEELDMIISPKGVADPAEFELSTNLEYAEAQAESTGINVSDLIKEAKLKDDDGSETLTFKLGDLPAGFEVEGATLIGGTGADREWSFNQGNLNDVVIKAPANYNGVVDFNLYTITTENDGHSLTEKHDVQLTITPTPEAEMNLSASIEEDVSTALDFSVIHQNGDDDESISKVWIKVDSIKDDLQLTLGDGGPALSTKETIGSDEYYVVEKGDLDNIYAQGKANWHGTTDFDVKYEVTDPGNDGLVDVTGVFDGNYTVDVAPITDKVTLDVTSGKDTEIIEAGEVNVELNVGNDGQEGGDYDGSEMLTRIIVEGVPEGVILTNPGSHLVGDGAWVLEVDEAMNGALTPDLSFDVHGSTINGDHDINITVVSEDAGNGTETTATETITITTDFAGQGGGENPAEIKQWEQTDFEPTEDTGFTLDEAINAEIDDSGVTSNSFTVTLKDLPEGTTVDGMTRTMVNGEEIWSATGTGSDAELQTLLEGITVAAPENWNSNKGQFKYNATLTTHVPSGGRAEADTAIDQTVTPVTDNAEIVITAPAVDEGNNLEFNINISNSADDPAWTIVDGKLYLQLDELAELQGGKLIDGNTELSTSAVSNVGDIPDGDYYVVELNGATTKDLTYVPKPDDEYKNGDVSLKAWVQGKESGAANVVTTDVSQVGKIEPVNNGYSLTVDDVTGDENPTASDKEQAIRINVGGTGLVDNDGSEEIETITLKNVPNDFLVFAGSSENNANLQNMVDNAGGDGETNTWVLGSEMPEYIAILPPKHWSGTIKDLTLSVISGETGLTAKDVSEATFDFRVNPVADGVELKPTESFGNEGEIVGLNLNAKMKDLEQAGPTDQSTESVTLELKGLGEHASFYIGDALSMDDVAYDDGTDTYTIAGLSQGEIDNLGFIQANSAIGNIEVRAQSVESGDTSEPSPWTDWKGINSNITDQISGPNDDTLLWTGESIDGRAGEDTIQLRFDETVTGEQLRENLDNIEVISMEGAGDNKIETLNAEDVISTTDDDNVLKLLGDDGDSVSLGDGWSKGSSEDGFNVYTYSIDNTVEATLHIQDGVTIE